MDTAEFGARVAPLLGEVKAVEFKRGGPIGDAHLLSKVIRAVLAMSNRRDGGLVVVGVAEEDHQLVWNGISDEDAATWVSDHLADKIAPYADPSVHFELSRVQWEDKTYLTIEVEEFDTVPVVCKRDYDNLLRQGAIYVRPRRKPESVEVPTAADARDLLELASEKLTRQFLATAERVGLLDRPAPEAGPNDEALFDSQLQDFLK